MKTAGAGDDQMIRTLKLENYRSFANYELGGLARVNLLVGPNNCGKTSVLEAVQLLAGDGDPLALMESAMRRGETSTEADEDDVRNVRAPIYHQFHGRTLDIGTSLRILCNDGLGCVQIEVVDPPAEDHPIAGFGVLGRPTITGMLRIRRANPKDIDLPLLEDGSIAWHRRMTWRPPGKSDRMVRPTLFVTAQSLHAHEMEGAWNQVEVHRREEEVVDTMRMLQADLDSIRFLSGSVTRRYENRPGIVLGLQSGGPRVPIGSYGEGMRRLLALSISLVRTVGGFLLFDEIDTGLHWTVMEKMWKVVVETARKSSIQVFATTHSLDCIQGLASLLKNEPDLGHAVSIQKIERGIERSVDFDAQAIVDATDLGVELR